MTEYARCPVCLEPCPLDGTDGWARHILLTHDGSHVAQTITNVVFAGIVKELVSA